MGAESFCIARGLLGCIEKTRERLEEMANHWISVITLWITSSPSTHIRNPPGWRISQAVLLQYGVLGPY